MEVGGKRFNLEKFKVVGDFGEGDVGFGFFLVS